MMDNKNKPLTPENKEELYGMLYEFDTHIRSMHDMLGKAFEEMDDISWGDEFILLSNYHFILGMLMARYDTIDQLLAAQARQEA